ncbi:MAG TPA: ATP-binding cassette domain-containing protein, partial [Cryptosporangiaceae bacterium]|nr:ATP-binding cassette domain-containing protein [Cryptosporangiaceae bacterium]
MTVQAAPVAAGTPADAAWGEVTAQAAPLAVASQGLTKRFRGGQVAVDHIDLAVPLGAVYGFLGPNGSGKTTTIRMLLGLIQPTSGTHALLGGALPDQAAAILPRVGSLVEGPAFHPYLSGRDNLRRLDAADRTADPATTTARIGAALDRVGLGAAAAKRYRNYSLGMRQRLGIAAALLQPRDLFILDEPTNGLDPQGTREVRALVSELAATGVTVLLSTHLLAEVEQICTHVGVMHVGKLVAQAPLAELRAGTAPRVRVDTDRPADAAATLR